MKSSLIRSRDFSTILIPSSRCPSCTRQIPRPVTASELKDSSLIALAKSFLRLGDLLFLQECVAAAGIGLRQFGIDLDGRAIAGNRLVPPLALGRLAGLHAIGISRRALIERTQGGNRHVALGDVVGVQGLVEGGLRFGGPKLPNALVI